MKAEKDVTGHEIRTSTSFTLFTNTNQQNQHPIDRALKIEKFENWKVIASTIYAVW